MQLARTILLVNSLVMTLLIGCSTEKDFFIMSPLPKVKNQFTPSIIWHRSIGDGSGEYYSQLSPAYDNYVIYVADRKGTVKAITLNSEILWSVDLSEYVGFFTANLPALLSSGLTVSGDNLYMGTETGKVIALNKANGEIVWKIDVCGEVLSQPVVSDGLVLIHTSNGVLQALDAQTGERRWSINLNTSSTLSVRGKSAPAIAYGAAIVGGNNGRISAIMLTQGEIIWQQFISRILGATEIDCLHDVNMTPVIDTNSGAIFAIAYNGDLVKIDMQSSQIIWKRDLGTVNDIIVANDVIYLVDQNDCVLAIHQYDGVTLWTQDALLRRNLTVPVIYDSYLVVGDSEGYLHWLDVTNGQFVTQIKINSSGLRSRPIIANDKLLIQAKDGTIYLIKR